MKPTEEELRAAVCVAIESPDYQRITNPPVQTGYLVGAVRRRWPGEYTASDALAIVQQLQGNQKFSGASLVSVGLEHDPIGLNRRRSGSPVIATRRHSES